MKIIQVTDLHLPEPGALLFGLDPFARLAACVDDINRNHADADLVVMSGDLANDGERGAYVGLQEKLKVLRPPVRMMMGNHDDRGRHFFWLNRHRLRWSMGFAGPLG